jgi:hypothetical protein
MQNSALPETVQAAEAIPAMCDGPISFTDLELVAEPADRRAEVAELFVSFLETAEVPDGLFTDDVDVELNIPHWNVRLAGPRPRPPPCARIRPPAGGRRPAR